MADTRLQAAVERVAPVIREHAQEAEEERSLPGPVHEAMVAAGLFRMFVPRAYGGFEADIVSGFEAIEAISRIDSAAGWSLQIAATAPATGGLFPDAAAREIFGDSRSVIAGGFSPPGTAEAADGGFRLHGRWAWASGCRNATWIISPALQMRDGAPEMLAEGQPILRACAYPVSEAQIVDTWHSLGMRGTGSHDVVADGVFIPERRAALFRPFNMDPGPAFSGPLYKFGMMPVIMGNAAVALGIARTAIDESLEVVKSKVPAHFQVPPGQRSSVHGYLGRAEASLNAGRAYFYEALRAAWTSAETGAYVGVEEKKHLQLAASFAAESAARAVDLVHSAVGGHGVLEAQYGFARHFRDVHTITQHALCSGTRFESMGQIMLGMETDWAFFNL